MTTFLAIDRNPADLNRLAERLKTHFNEFELLTAESVAAALALAAEHSPDILLLAPSVTMNDEGYHLCETLKTDDRTRAIPLLFFSSEHHEPPARYTVQNRLPEAVLDPDCNLFQLLSTVRTLLRLPKTETPSTTVEAQKNCPRVALAATEPFQLEETLLNTIQAPIYYKNTKGVFLGCNNIFAEKIIGLGRSEIIGRGVFDLSPGIPADLAKIYDTKDRELLARPATQIYDAEARCADGHRRTFLFNTATFCDRNGKVAGIVGLMLDLTEKKKVEEELRWELSVNVALAKQSNALLAASYDIDAVCEQVLKYAKALTRSKHGYVSVIDPNTGANVGHTATHMMEQCRLQAGLSEKVSFTKGPDGQYPGLWGHALNTQTAFYTNAPDTHPAVKGLPEGHIGLKRFLTVPVSIQTKLVGQIALANAQRNYTDQDLNAIEQISELFALAIFRHRSEEENEVLQGQLRQAQKMEAIGTLAGGIAHDFNNILAAIIGYVEMAQMEVSENPTAKHHLEQVLKAGYRAKDLVRHILAFSRQAEQERKPIQIHLIVKEAMKLLRASLPTTIEIRTKIAPGATTVLADPTQVHQVLMNLCTNAHHAMMVTGGTLAVELETVNLTSSDISGYGDIKSGKYIRLKIQDTGAGMKREILDRIFDPYFTTKQKGVGTGLGLAMVYSIVKAHEGMIKVESELGVGTLFEVFLPRIESEAESDAEAFGPIATGSERILMVDDEASLVELGKRMLMRLGYHVVTRTSSIEALEAFRDNPAAYDVIITDMTMPNMTGDQLAKHILALRPDIPVILCTGFSELITEEKAREMGLAGFLFKPLSLRDLGSVVRKALDSKTKKT